MRMPFRLLLGLAALVSTAVSAAAEAGAPVHVVTYIEVAPMAGEEAAALLTAFGAANRGRDGNLRFDVLRRDGWPSHFAILELWKDRPAFEAHESAASARELRGRLAVLLVAPYDRRPLTGFVTGSAGSAEADGSRAAVHVVTHVDVVPPAKDQGMALLKDLAEASANDAGALRFEVLQQNSRPNHFTLVEAWRDRQAFDAHVTAAHTRRFRDALLPLTGSLYDERLYRRLD